MHSTLVLTSLLVAFLWAVNSVAQKHATNNLSHPTAMAVFSVMYFTVMLLYIGHHKELISKELRNIIPSAILIMFAAVLLNFLANILYFKMLKTNGLSIVTALTSTMPIFVALLSFMVLRESLSAKHIAGIVAVVTGVVLISQ
ncbi:EamA family transporter [bacterium]|nr:EamA family transporter [bacterium]NBX48806.1 EamA family transporter [bacterium]